MVQDKNKMDKAQTLNEIPILESALGPPKPEENPVPEPGRLKFNVHFIIVCP